jgi:hypothetical protein
LQKLKQFRLFLLRKLNEREANFDLAGANPQLLRGKVDLVVGGDDLVRARTAFVEPISAAI